jgi:hypothetical protein
MSPTALAGLVMRPIQGPLAAWQNEKPARVRGRAGEGLAQGFLGTAETNFKASAGQSASKFEIRDV